MLHRVCARRKHQEYHGLISYGVHAIALGLFLLRARILHGKKIQKIVQTHVCPQNSRETSTTLEIYLQIVSKDSQREESQATGRNGELRLGCR